jgi:predicted RNase H-like nuclease (RuvC/YqgF family)
MVRGITILHASYRYRGNLRDTHPNREVKRLLQRNRESNEDEMMRQTGELKAQVERVNRMNHQLKNQVENEKGTLQQLMTQNARVAVEMCRVCNRRLSVTIV